jgi:hypothetical protein
VAPMVVHWVVMTQWVGYDKCPLTLQTLPSRPCACLLHSTSVLARHALTLARAALSTMHSRLVYDADLLAR